MLRCVLGVGLREHQYSCEIREAASAILMDTYLMRRRIHWYGHVRRRGEQAPAQQVLNMTVQGERTRGSFPLRISPAKASNVRT